VTLAGLASLGLAERLPGEPPRYLAVPPGAALAGHLADVEKQFRDARDRVTELALAYHRHRAAPDLEPGTVIEVVSGRAAVLQRLEQIEASAREQIRSLDEAPYVSLSGVSSGSRRLAAGVTRRAIYDSAAISKHAAPDIEELMRAGQQARVLPSLPLRVYLVDQRLAVLPLRYALAAGAAASGADSLIIVHPSALLSALSELFEILWNRALPLPSGQESLTAPGPRQPAADQRLISLLLAGLTDTASARHLGVSQRTVQRRVAALLDELGVQTRFQAGAKLAFRDAETTANRARRPHQH
jgi:DNA-binding CsgD family transcriptional regulator